MGLSFMNSKEISYKILKLVKEGYSYHYAAGQLGMSYRKSVNFRKENPDFHKEIKKILINRNIKRLSDLAIYKKEGAEKPQDPS
jgi:molybdenum-dependent DNA-binding transcriptional regulator ModE